MKKICIFLLCVLVFTVLTACAASGDGDTAAGTTAADMSTDIAEETTEPPEYTAPGVKYDGEEITFYIWHTDTKWQLTMMDGIYAEEENGEPMNDAFFRRTSTVEELLDVSISTYLNTSMSGYNSSIQAGDDAYGVGIANASSLNGMLGVTGLLLDLNTIDTLDLERSWWDSKATDEFTIGGKVFTTTGDLCVYNTGAAGCLYFNKEMIEEYSLDSPYKLVNDKKWTIDKLYEHSAAVVRDLDGNGVYDEKDVLGIGCSASVLQQCICSSGIRVTTKNSEGISELTLNNPKTTIVIDKLIKLLRDKNIAMYSNDYSGKATTGDVFTDVMLPSFMANRLLFNFNWIFAALDLRDMEADFGIIPMPLFDEKQDEYYSLLSPYWSAFITVPSTCSDTDMIGNLLDAMGYYSQQLVTTAFIDVTVTNKALRDDDSANMLNIIFDSMVYDLYNVYGWGSIYNSVAKCADTGVNNFASSYASMEASAQAAIEKTFEQLLG